VAPLVGVLGNDQVALSIVMAAGALVALLALAPSLRWGHPDTVGVSTSDNADESVPGEAVSEPA
jgi:MFS transporter, DHA1 family, multidrug resistance protein